MASPKLRPTRTAGVLLHPTSLPSPFGIGDLGPSAYAWVDALARAKLTWWQILPLGPTGYGDSPYQCFSAFAGNPTLVSPHVLEREALLRSADYANVSLPVGHVDYGAVLPFKTGLLDRAWEHFQAGYAQHLRTPFEEFQRRHSDWLDDYSLFMSLKDAHGGVCWLEWPMPVRLRQPEALASARKELADRIARHRFRQFLFFRQWQALREYAQARGVKIIGDAPIFVSGDSADVWANPHLFLLDAQRRQTVQAGVPPDYFSATGQLWGNPLYDWNALRKSGYAWWSARLRGTLNMVDVVRLDHFRGFAAAWHVAGDAVTAVKGDWIPGPGLELFERMRKELGSLPLIAEDLGLITPDVDRLRVQLNLPGMRVLHFAFSDPHNKYLPHNYDMDCVAYTGTHDNDTSRGWYEGLTDKERDFVRRYLARDGSDIAWDLIRAAWSSVADLAVAPLQDILNLGTAARMNTPGKPDGNWTWRIPDGSLNDGIWHRLMEMTEMYGRG